MRVQKSTVLSAVLCAVIGALATGIAAPRAAADAEGTTLVVLGDSFAATAPILASADDGCTHATTSWPNQLAARTGLTGPGRFLDVSCNGGTIDTGAGWTLVHQVKKAAAQGAFGAGTKAVLVQAGWNDTWGASGGVAFPSVDCLLNFTQGCGLDAADQHRLPDYRAVTATAYADRLRVVVDYIRYYAPNASVGIVGYPEVFTPNQTGACMLVAGQQVTQPRAEGYLTYLDRLQEAQRGGAAQLGVAFVDSRAVTAGHASCTGESWISGLGGADSPLEGAPIHPNAAGNAAVAAAIGHQFGL